MLSGEEEDLGEKFQITTSKNHPANGFNATYIIQPTKEEGIFLRSNRVVC